MGNILVMNSPLMSDTKVWKKHFQSKRDQWFGFYSSLIFHVFMLVILGVSFIKPIEFGVDSGPSAMDVQLVAGEEQVAIETVEEIIPQEQPVIQEEKIFVSKVMKELPKPQIIQKGNSEINASSVNHGALVSAKPDYLHNPAPPYPFRARQNAWEGVVYLFVVVNASGHSEKVNVEKTSGYDILDEAASKIVKTWRFAPAKIGNVAVESSVQIPVRFRLEDYKGR